MVKYTSERRCFTMALKGQKFIRFTDEKELKQLENIYLENIVMQHQPMNMELVGIQFVNGKIKCRKSVKEIKKII